MSKYPNTYVKTDTIRNLAEPIVRKQLESLPKEQLIDELLRLMPRTEILARMKESA